MTKTAIEIINSVSEKRFTFTVESSKNPSQVLNKLGIYQNGRNIEAVRERANDLGISFQE